MGTGERRAGRSGPERHDSPFPHRCLFCRARPARRGGRGGTAARAQQARSRLCGAAYSDRSPPRHPAGPRGSLRFGWAAARIGSSEKDRWRHRCGSPPQPTGAPLHPGSPRRRPHRRPSRFSHDRTRRIRPPGWQGPLRWPDGAPERSVGGIPRQRPESLRRERAAAPPRHHLIPLRASNERAKCPAALRRPGGSESPPTHFP